MSLLYERTVPGMDAARKHPFRIYFWLVRNEITGKVHKTPWRMTEADAEARFPDAVRIEADSMLIEGPSSGTGSTRPW